MWSFSIKGPYPRSTLAGPSHTGEDPGVDKQHYPFVKEAMQLGKEIVRGKDRVALLSGQPSRRLWDGSAPAT